MANNVSTDATTQTIPPSQPGSDGTSKDYERFVVSDPWRGYEVTLEVDPWILSTERAEVINNFWSGADRRLEAERGDIVRAVVREAGGTLIALFLEDGGQSFVSDFEGAMHSVRLQHMEGWHDGQPQLGPFGWCGIRVIAAEVESVDFEQLMVQEVTHAD